MNAKILKFRGAGGDPMDKPRAEEEAKFNRIFWMSDWLRAGLATPTIAVLTVLFDHMWRGDSSWPSTQEIADLAGCSQKTAIKHLALAEDAGWIEKHTKKRSTTVYVASYPDSKKATTPLNEVQRTTVGGTAHDCRRYSEPLNEVQRTTVGGTAESIKETKKETIKLNRGVEIEREAENLEHQKPNPNDHDLVRFILETLADYDINISIGECDKIAARLILSELDEADRRRYLLDWVPRLREKIDNGAAQRKVLHWLGGAKSIGWWQADVRAARRPAGGGETENEAWQREQALQANSYASMDELMNAIALGGQK